MIEWMRLPEVFQMGNQRCNPSDENDENSQFSPSYTNKKCPEKLDHDTIEISSEEEYISLKDKTNRRDDRHIPGKNQKDTESSDRIDDTLSAPSEPPTPFYISLIYGLINTAIVLPVMMSFGSIIYSDEIFRPHLPTLIKLTVISGMVHQITFTTFSSLPFAVGQVQDAGLIFLSSMASNIVTYCQKAGHEEVDEILATVTIGLGVYTFILGVGLVIISKCDLARYVQKLPTSVVGGYLAFIGFFCGQSGMALMGGVEVKGVTEWYKMFESPERVMWILPGLLGGLVIYILVRTVRHMAVLPCCIIGIVVVFYLVLNFMGMSVQQARDDGWVSQADAPPVWYKTWDFLRFDKVIWSALPCQTITLLGMIFVVALSSSLDIAAIELELSDDEKPLNYNHELQTVGISNIISGLTGGYTGSYIFSQSIFSLRSGIRSRASGYIIATAEFISVILPLSILSYLPNFFFGSLLIMIAIDLMYDWLWDVRNKITRTEYFVTLATFVSIEVFSVEYGILVGLAIYFVGWKVLGLDMGRASNVVMGDEDGGIAPTIFTKTNQSLPFGYEGTCMGEYGALRQDSVNINN